MHRRGEPIPSSIPPPSIILAADCVYFEPAFSLLVQTLADLTPTSDGPDPEILFCYKKRRKVRLSPLDEEWRSYSCLFRVLL